MTLLKELNEFVGVGGMRYEDEEGAGAVSQEARYNTLVEDIAEMFLGGFRDYDLDNPDDMHDLQLDVGGHILSEIRKNRRGVPQR